MLQITEVQDYGYQWFAFNESPESPEQIEAFYSTLQGDELAIFNRVCSGLPEAETFSDAHPEMFPWTKKMRDKVRTFRPGKRPPNYDFFRPAWCCYENSFRLAEEIGALYCEGVTISPTGPQIHAWVSLEGDDVLDLTWPSQHLNRYFGASFDVPLLKANGITNGGFIARVMEARGSIICRR